MFAYVGGQRALTSPTLAGIVSRNCIVTYTVTGETFNPFRYSAPVDADDLIDRDEEAETLLSLAEGEHNTRLAAPRGYGKTSLLRRVVREAEEDAGLNVVLVDFWGVATRADVALRLEDGYRTLRGPVRRHAHRLLTDARLRASVGPAAVELDLSTRENADRLLFELLDVPRRACEKTRKRTLVVFDEFQEVLRAQDGVDAVMRTRIQHHSSAVSYVFAGCHPGLLAELFDTPTRPLYGQARAVALGRLADRDIADHVAHRFEQTNRQPGRALDYLLRLADGHPRRTMMLAHYLWSFTPPGGQADEGTWGRAQRATYDELAEAYARLWEGLAQDSDRRALTAIAAGRPLFARETLRTHGLTKGSATRSRGRLVALGEVHRIDGSLKLTDPLLAAWLVAGRRTPPLVVERTGGGTARARRGGAAGD